MPTTKDEAREIISISVKYLPLDKLQEFAHELNEKVGKTTKNNSLKVTLQMLSDGADAAINEVLKNGWAAEATGGQKPSEGFP